MHARLFFVACASAALLGAAACNNNSAKTTTEEMKPAPDTTAAAKGTAGEEQQRPIALNGCLQKGDGSNYILTQINEPPKGEPVAQQDLKEAEHAYRLNAKNTSDDNWDKMVGHQVRVSGTLAKAADIDHQVGTSGSDAKDRPKIHEGDLAQVDVADIQMTAASCGGHAAKPATKAHAKPRRK